jgi:hypothetical protein
MVLLVLVLAIIQERIITFKMYGWLLENILREEVAPRKRFCLKIVVVVGFLDPFL